MVIGSYPTAFILLKEKGRREAIMLSVFVGMLGIWIQMIEVTAIMCIGRFI
jgi:hypothetical protein